MKKYAFGFLGGMIFLLSCRNNPIAFKNAYALLDHIPDQHILSIPTYEESGQAIHPDILFFENRWENYHFILTMTPYPYSCEKYENPCIMASEDGVHFVEIDSEINPLTASLRDGYNNDPDIIYIRKENELGIYYLQTMKPDSQNVCALMSENGTDWRSKRIIHYDLRRGEDFIVSPSVVFHQDQYLMFYVNLSKKVHPIQYIESSNGIDWNKKNIHSLLYDLPEKLIPWHIDIIKTSTEYLMLCCGPFPDTELYIAMSTDLIHWTFERDPLITRSGNFFYDCKRIYRSTGIAEGNILIIWFSFLKYDGQWGMGLKKYDLSQLLN